MGPVYLVYLVYPIFALKCFDCDKKKAGAWYDMLPATYEARTGRDLDSLRPRLAET